MQHINESPKQPDCPDAQTGSCPTIQNRSPVKQKQQGVPDVDDPPLEDELLELDDELLELEDELLELDDELLELDDELLELDELLLEVDVA